MLEAEYEKEREKIEGKEDDRLKEERIQTCLLYTSPSPRD